MNMVLPARRAALLGVAIAPLALSACDVALFALDPRSPVIEQTWSLPVTSKSVSVADLLPSGNTVSIKQPDSSAFMLTVAAAAISRVVGNDCPACLPLNGTNAIKPGFTLVANNSTALPTDVVSAAVTNGKITITLTNNMSFDPLYVRTGAGAQGHMVIVIRSGTVVLGRDSVQGAAVPSGLNQTRWPAAPAAGSVLTRVIRFNSGTVTTGLICDVTVVSPLGDHLEFINANGILNASAAIDSLEVASVSLNIPSRTINSGSTDAPLKDVPGSDKMVRAGLTLTISNPFTGVTGTDTVQFTRFSSGAQSQISKEFTIASGSSVQSVSLDSAEVQTLVQSDSVKLTVRGPVSAPAPVTVTPKQRVTFDAQIVAVIHLSGGK